MEPSAAEPLETRVVADGLDFPEGPIALDDGSVLVVEIRGGRLSRVTPDGSVSTVADLGGGPNGAAIGPDGAVYVTNCGGFLFLDDDEGMPVSTGMPSADYRGGSIQRVDLDTGEHHDLYRECDGQPLVGPNDLVFDGQGGFYFTDNGKIFEERYAMGSLYYARADGSSITRLAAWQAWPNGIGLSPDGRTLYVAHTVLGWLTRWEVTGPGQIRAASGGVAGDLVGKAMGGQSFDSLALEADGTVCVATLAAAGQRTGGITVFPPAGPPTLLSVDDPSTTNICFGGPELTTAYITSAGRGLLLAADWPRPGLRLAHP